MTSRNLLFHDPGFVSGDSHQFHECRSRSSLLSSTRSHWNIANSMWQIKERIMLEKGISAISWKSANTWCLILLKVQTTHGIRFIHKGWLLMWGKRCHPMESSLLIMGSTKSGLPEITWLTSRIQFFLITPSPPWEGFPQWQNRSSRTKSDGHCGDGGFMMNSQELETAVRLKMNLVVMIQGTMPTGWSRNRPIWTFPNSGWIMETPTLSNMPKVMGLKVIVLGNRTIDPAVQQCFDTPGVHLVEVPVDYNENNRILNHEIKERSLKSEILKLLLIYGSIRPLRSGRRPFRVCRSDEGSWSKSPAHWNDSLWRWDLRRCTLFKTFGEISKEYESFHRKMRRYGLPMPSSISNIVKEVQEIVNERGDQLTDLNRVIKNKLFIHLQERMGETDLKECGSGWHQR